MKYIVAFFACWLSLTALFAQPAIPPSEGDGSVDQPYHIQSAANLYWISQNPQMWDKHFKQISTIHLAGSASWDGGKGWTPIGQLTATEEIPFLGTYDGGNHEITNLNINRPDAMGQALFGVIGNNGIVKNVQLTNFNFACFSVSGGLAGLNKGTIENCHVQGNLMGQGNKTGGLVGENQGAITRCSAHVTIIGNDEVGGLVGFNNFNNAVIRECFSSGSVSGLHMVGGFVGNQNSRIFLSYSLADVEGISATGGFVGNANGVNYFDVTFTGGNYSRGNVTRLSGSEHTSIGGFAGQINRWCYFKQNYATGRVQAADGEPLVANGFAGLFTNERFLTLSNVWNTSTSQQNESVGNAQGNTSAEMRQLMTYLVLGWDFVGERVNDTEDFWNINALVNNGFPFHVWSHPAVEHAQLPAPAGQGTESNPYLMSSLDNLFWVAMEVANGRDRFYGKYLRQTHDIDATDTRRWFEGKGWYPIGGQLNGGVWPSFDGSYDGNGNSITSFYMNNSSRNGGLFGFTSKSATIQNLKVLDAELIGLGDNSGILVGSNSGVIHNCATSGTIQGSGFIGGLVGLNSSLNGATPVISNSSSHAIVTSAGTVGGLLGRNYSGGKVEYCYVTGEVYGNQHKGGFVGQNNGTIRHSYCAVAMESINGQSYNNQGFAASVSTGSGYEMTGNFWDTTLSGQSATTGNAIGKPTEEMNKLFTFLVLNWDFVGETINGTDNIWNINPGRNNGYPYHSMHYEGDPVPELSAPLGEGSSANNPYLISSLEDLFWVSYQNYTSNNTFAGKYLKQTQSIDATETALWFSGQGWLPIGDDTRRFTGQYDGHGKIINGLTIQRSTNYNGLFGSVGHGGVVKRLGLIDVDVKGSWFNGSLVGNLDKGTITECFARGVVAGNGDVGGFVGEQQQGLITNSYTHVNLIRPDGITQNGFGGFVGRMQYGKIKNCYATGSITATGLPQLDNNGFAGLVIEGPQLEMTGNFWDIDASGQNSSFGQYASGLTTQQMQDGRTFTAKGWDFLCETTNGSQDLWAQNPTDNNGYPFLSWQDYQPGQLASMGGEPTVGSQMVCPGGMAMDVELKNYEGQVLIWQSSVNSSFSGDVTDYQVAENILPGPALGATNTPVWLRAKVQNGVCDAVYSELHHVNMGDNEKPTITSQLTDEEVSANDECNYLLIDYTTLVSATDNCTPKEELIISQNPVAGSMISGSENLVTLTVADASGNETQVSFNVAVKDRTPPSFQCAENKTIQLPEGESVYTVQGLEFDPTNGSDNCGIAAIVNDFNQQASLDGVQLPVGNNIITWIITDLAGNSMECSIVITVQLHVGTSNFYAQEVKLYPNPTKDIITLNSTGNKILSLSLMDINGKVWLAENGDGKDELTLDLSPFPAGMYFLRLTKGSGIQYYKIIKE
jgi:hypothetical protein